MPLTKEQLMIPRYLCTGTPGKPLWPMCEWEDGLIISEDQIFTISKYATDFPHLFRPLQWWYGRNVDEMPGWVKFEDGSFDKVVAWNMVTKNIWQFVLNDGRKFSYDMTVWDWSIQPATREEYEEYLKQKEG